MAQKELQKHTVRWYSEGQLVRICRVADGAHLSKYYPTASERAFYCWEKQDEPGRAFDFRTPVHTDLCLAAVYGEAEAPGEGRFAVGAGQGSLLASHWQEVEPLRMKKTDEDTYRITLMLYRGDVLQFKRQGSWRGQIGIAGLVPDGERESFCFFGTPAHGDITVLQSGEYAFVWHDRESPSVTVKRLADAPACSRYPDWRVVGYMNGWSADGAQRLSQNGEAYTAYLEISEHDVDVRDGLCHFMLHNPVTGQYCGAPDGGHLTAAAGKYRLNAELPLGHVTVQPLDPEQEEENVI